MSSRSPDKKSNEPVIENRRARNAYLIGETLECGIELRGTEIKSIRDGQISIAEGWVRAEVQPLSLSLHGVHIAEYAPAGPNRQHDPDRVRRLLAHRREIEKLADQVRSRNATIVPLKVYFLRGRAKILIGVGLGKKKADKREDMAKRDARRDMDRAMSRRRV
jgi:SsrA-binding protein